MAQLSKTVLFGGRTAVLVCDGRCDKAWGINTRPRFYYQESLDVARRLAAGTEPRDPDDYVYMPDDVLGTAPADPGTYEGDHGKPSAVPLTDSSRMNRWCARECERSALLEPGEKLISPDLTRPKPNIPGRPHVYVEPDSVSATGSASLTEIVVPVVCEPDPRTPGLMKIGMPGPTRRSHYYQGEAESAAICVALEDVKGRVARGELPAVDDFTVRVVFVDEFGARREPGEVGS